MSQEQLQDVVHYLRRLASLPAGRGVPDAELLGRFVSRHDEAAFELLVWRHGKMVLATCRRVLRDAHTAEDAFQATFLALARRAGSIGKRHSVGGWLYKVAYRVALAARERAARQRARERPLTDQPSGADPASEAARRELRRVIDDEVSRLVEKYRLPFVLCCLEGKSNAEAAHELGCPVGTIESRLTRARERLRAGLARRGLALPAGCLATALAQEASAAVPAALAGWTAKAAALVAANPAAAGVISAKVAALTEGVLRAMFVTKLKIAAAVLLAAGIAVAAAGSLGRAALVAGVPGEKTEKAPKPAAHPRGRKTKPATTTVLDGKVRKAEPAQRTITVQSAPMIKITNVRISVMRFNDATGRPEQEYPTDTSHDTTHHVSRKVKVLIDGKEGKLADLTRSTPVQLTLEDGLVTRIEANGDTMNARVAKVDAKKGAITIGYDGHDYRYELVKHAPVVIDGQPSALANLKADLPVILQFSAVKPTLVLSIRAEGPKVNCLLKAVDPRRRTLTVRLTKEYLTAPDVPVAEAARLMIHGKPAKFADLKAGMDVTLQMAADPHKSLVIGVVGN